LNLHGEDGGEASTQKRQKTWLTQRAACGGGGSGGGGFGTQDKASIGAKDGAGYTPTLRPNVAAVRNLMISGGKKREFL
jgi:hypothetical protein